MRTYDTHPLAQRRQGARAALAPQPRAAATAATGTRMLQLERKMFYIHEIIDFLIRLDDVSYEMRETSLDDIVNGHRIKFTK